MDTAEKVRVFKSFEELTQEIIKDRDTRDMLAQRYAIRFIMLNNFNEFRNLAKFMVNIGVDMLNLETLIDEGEDDIWITKDVLKDAIKKCKDSTFVTPFSEVARFYNDDDFRGFFNEIMLLEDIHSPRKRIYIPLIGLQNRFTDFLNHFGRIQESAPIWRLDAETQSVEVFFAKYKDFKLPNGAIQCQLDSLREWLMFWKKQAPQERIVCTSRPIAAKHKYSKPDNIFVFTKIENAYDFMTQFLELTFPFEYKEEEKSYWEILLNKIDKSSISTFSYESFVRKYFNKLSLNASDVIMEWTDSNNTEFERWLLKQYVLHTEFEKKYPYVTKCVENVVTLMDEYHLISMIATLILYDTSVKDKPKLAEERRKVIIDNRQVFVNRITADDKEWLFSRIKETFQRQKDLQFAVDLCTGVFDFEKVLLMGWAIHNPNNTKLINAINESYPEYAAYLNSNKPTHFKPENQWAIEYFEAYKNAKMKDKLTDEIVGFIKNKNASAASFYQWFFDFDSSHSVLAEIQAKLVYRPDKIFWVDGLGAEFLSYILYLIENENSDMKVIRSQITRSNIPSSTNHNRFEGECVRKFSELDELGHNHQGYKYLETLRDELTVIKKIIHEILDSCKMQKCTVVIVSDHGLSCLSRKAISKKYDGKFEHEGRYIKTTESAMTDTDYLVHTNDLDNQTYKIALTHSSLSKVPTHQVHGGCTPEEVLVPFILLSNKNITTSIKSNIILPQDDIMLSNPTINLTIIPQPQNVQLVYEGTIYDMDRMGTSWTIVLQGATEGKHKIEVQPKGQESTVLEINIIGVNNNSSIDDMFDL